uniref:Uncharacterized protein n=1 Tax=Neobodo designis TaxID=312471 RepID=A0A7S1PXB9_NEODS
MHDASTSSFDVLSSHGGDVACDAAAVLALSTPEPLGADRPDAATPPSSSAAWSRVSSRLDVVSTPPATDSPSHPATPHSHHALNSTGWALVSAVPLGGATWDFAQMTSCLRLDTAFAARTVTGMPHMRQHRRGGGGGSEMVAVAAPTTPLGAAGRAGVRTVAAGRTLRPWVHWACQPAELREQSRHVALRRNTAPAWQVTGGAEKRRGKQQPAQQRCARPQHHQQHHHYQHHTEQRRSFHPRSDVKAPRVRAPKVRNPRK